MRVSILVETIIFSNVSFVGPNTLASRLKDAGMITGPNGATPYTDNVLVSQVVPNYESDSSDVVKQYRKLIPSTRPASPRRSITPTSCRCSTWCSRGPRSSSCRSTCTGSRSTSCCAR